MNYAKFDFPSISGVIFSPASGGFAPDPDRGSTPGPDLPLLCKVHDIWLGVKKKFCCFRKPDRP